MKKHIIFIFITLIFTLTGCTSKDKDENKYKIPTLDDSFTYYEKTIMNQENKLYVFGKENNRVLNNNELTTGQAIQGLFARDEVTFYLSTGQSNYEYWLSDLEETYQITTEEVTLNQMIQMYQEKFDETGYILYDSSLNSESVNVATSLAGITGYLPIDQTLKDKAESLGLTMQLDVSDKSEMWAFETYKDEFNNGTLIQQRPDIPHLRDYGVTFKYFYFYQDGVSNTAINFRSTLHRWAKADAPIFGWGPGTEDSHVGIATRNGQFTIPSDYSFNTTVFSAVDFYQVDRLEQPNDHQVIEKEDGKHYVSIIRSDGDNIQTWYNYFPFDNKDMGAVRGDFPIGWSIQPSLIDIAPNIMKDVYDNAKANDYFVAPVSGMGYMYPSNYPEMSRFMGGLEVYLDKTDLNIVQILDSGPYKDVIEWYSQVPSLKGGVYMYGEKYAGGRGSIYWSDNGKPFVAFRESMWDTTPESMATRINSYPKDPTDISGYTMVNLHPWSHSYQDVVEMVGLLDENVVVVTPEQFFDLIIENVEKTDKTLS